MPVWMSVAFFYNINKSLLLLIVLTLIWSNKTLLLVDY